MDRSRTLPAALAVVALAVVPAPPAAAAAPAAVAAPGSVVRWGGPGTTRCGWQGETFPPLGGTCFYPVDLLAAPGSLTAVRWVGETRHTAEVRVGEYPYPVQRLDIPDDSKVHLSAEDAARAARESERVAALWDLRTPRRFTLPLTPPLADLPAGGRFGSRRILNGEPRSPHTGTDYAVAAGTPVRAVAAGRVVLAEEHFFSGRSVFVDHGDGLISMYFHLSGVAVAPGDAVEAGEILGLVGATGRATGPHLHFGLRWRGARVDPAELLAPTARLLDLAR